ncbi:MAG TPA: biotin-dependent carboxyltransferase family protein, partial [Thermoanaerobaculia bacterium]
PPERRVADGRAPILRIASPGLSATIQGVPGGGRGLGASGIPPGGAIDPIGLARANARVGNAPGLAGIEMAFVGCELEVLEDTVVACAGGFEPERNGRPAPPEEAFTVAKGDRLRLGRVRRGVWGYLAVRGGLEPPARFAPQPRLSAGDLVAAGTERAAAARVTNAGDPEAPREIRLRALPGPEADAFAPSELARFFESSWRVSTESDRRGLRLEGLDGAAPLAHLATSTSEIPPSGMVPGSIQVPGGGLPIVLGPDGPVTGGYPRIATVIGADRPLLGRAGPGALVRFVRVGLEEALEARSSLSAGVS